MRKLSFLCAALLLIWMASDVNAGGYHGGYHGHFYGGGFYNRGFGYNYGYALDPSAYAAFQVIPSTRAVEYYVPVPQVRYIPQVTYSAPQVTYPVPQVISQPELNVQPLPAYQPRALPEPIQPQAYVAPAYDPSLQSYAAPNASVIALEVQQGYLTTRTVDYLQTLNPFARFTFLRTRYGRHCDRLFTHHFGSVPAGFHSRFATRFGNLPRSGAGLPGSLPQSGVLPGARLPRSGVGFPSTLPQSGTLPRVGLPGVLPQNTSPRTLPRNSAPSREPSIHKRG